MTYTEYIVQLNSLLAAKGFDLVLTTDDFHFLSEVVTDANTFERRLSTALTRALSPPIHSGEFYHYTSAPNEILASGTLRLTSITKRIGESEIQPFLKRFGFDYPQELIPGSTTPRYQESIASQIFYTSFTETTLLPTEEEYFWKTFAGLDGARLRFRICLRSGCLRRMVYGSELDTIADVFRCISELTAKSLGKVFFWEDAATVCALCLPTSYNIEKEVRLLTRPGSGLPRGMHRGFEFLEAKIGCNPQLLLDIELLEIQTDRPSIGHPSATLIPRTP